MDLRLYELTFVLDPQLEQNQIDEIVQKIESLITDSKGEIEKKDLWGKRRLAYEIKKRQYGFYIYLLFKSPVDVIDKIERDFKLNESVLRFLTIRLSKAAIKQMEKGQKSRKKPVVEAVEKSKGSEPENKDVVEEKRTENE
jgi:small subunit ribosomal protein S6